MSNLIKIIETNSNPLLTRDLGTVARTHLQQWCADYGYGIVAINKTTAKLVKI